MAKDKDISLRGIPQLPSGFVLGRLAHGAGPPQLISMTALAQRLVSSGSVAGPQGKPGINGINGFGTNGINGHDGEDGLDGFPGRQGVDGAASTVPGPQGPIAAWARDGEDGQDSMMGALNTPSFGRPGFGATLSTTYNTLPGDGSWHKMPYDTTSFNVGNYYSTANNRWTPPAGLIFIVEKTLLAGTLTVNSPNGLGIFKNGSLYKYTLFYEPVASTTLSMNFSVLEFCNGTDYYEAAVACSTTAGYGSLAPSNSDFGGVLLG